MNGNYDEKSKISVGYTYPAAAVIFSSGISALAEEKPMKEGSGFLPNLFVR